MNYNDFLESKRKNVIESGFEVEELNTHLFDFQKYIVKNALRCGKYAIFADCGIGKTIMQLEWAHWVVLHTNKPVLILAPLAVSGQTINEGIKFDIKVEKYINQTEPGIYITNYEQIHNVNTSIFSGIVLDESSILKNFTGKYRILLTESFKLTPYKLCCTATPSPNDYNELGNHAEFLNIMDNEDMRAKWFIRDEGMNNYRLKGHGKVDFFAWISSWATMLTNPADIGFDGSKFILPELKYIEHEIKTELKLTGRLWNEGIVNATNFNAELRRSMKDRLTKAAEIANSTKENYIVWIKLNEEGDYLKKLIPDAVEVTGSEDYEVKEKKLLGFANNEFRVLITKSKIAQFGLNYQNCHNQIFASLDFSFESLYQSIRRSYRFGQKSQVNIYILTTDTMENVTKSIERKETQFREMQTEMNKNINSQVYGLRNDYEFKEVKESEYWLMKGDSCIEIKRIEDNSVDLIIFSPPFSSLFTYSNYIHDMGNNENHDQFFKQYSFLLRDMYRILKPGRIMACHTKDLAVYKNSSGYSGLYNFTGEHHKAVENEGFKYHSKITIWTDPVLEMQRTKTQRLLYKQVTQDSTYSGVGLPEYVTLFRKWEGSEEDWNPVTNITKNNFPLDTWQKWASPVWFDIRRTDVLNNSHKGIGQGDEKHIAPLQLEVINRIVNLWSNENEIVFTPFLGIGSESYVSVKNNRKTIGIELKDSYFDVACKNVRDATLEKTQLKLFI